MSNEVIKNSRFVNIGNVVLGLITPKAACSFLKCVAGYYKNGIWNIETEGAVGDKYFELNKTWQITVPYKDGIKMPLRKFVVYRDPFERFVSLYNEKIKCGHLLKDYVNAGLSQSSTFEEFLCYAESLFLEGKYIENHLQIQSCRYDIKDIDDIVKIEDLDDYLSYHNIEMPSVHINTAPQRICYADYEQYRKRIMVLYYEDYKILKSNKVWLRKQIPAIDLAETNFTPSTQYLEHIMYALEKYRPLHILDFGSGNTTRLFEYYINNVNTQATLFSVDHNEDYALKNKNVHIFDANINPLFSSYNDLIQVLKEQEIRFDFISIDGPIGYKSQVARTDILDVVINNLLADDFSIFIHDSERNGEKNLIVLLLKLLDDAGIKYYVRKLPIKEKGLWISTYAI